MEKTLLELYPELEQFADRPVQDLPRLIRMIEGKRRKVKYNEQCAAFLEQQRARRAAGRRRSRRNE